MSCFDDVLHCRCNVDQSVHEFITFHRSNVKNQIISAGNMEICSTVQNQLFANDGELIGVVTDKFIAHGTAGAGVPTSTSTNV